MSTTTDCRREDLTCQPDRTIIAEKPEKGECATMSEKQFMRDHTTYSAISSWLFAISGATNIGVISVFASKILGAVERGQPVFKSTDPKVPAVFGNKKYNLIALGATAFGGVAMGLSNWLESKKVVTEWQLGAGKMQRKANGAEREMEKSSPAEQASVLVKENDNIADSKQSKAPESVSNSHNLMLASIAGFVFLIISALPNMAYALDNVEAEYMRDKNYAINHVNHNLEQQCLLDISQKTNQANAVKKIKKSAFSDGITREVYQSLYWKNSNRGVAFIMPVQVNDKILGDITSHIACFYSMTENGLEFQLSQQIIRRL